jgi:hypothetical protein
VRSIQPGLSCMKKITEAWLDAAQDDLSPRIKAIFEKVN